MQRRAEWSLMTSGITWTRRVIFEEIGKRNTFNVLKNYSSKIMAVT